MARKSPPTEPKVTIDHRGVAHINVYLNGIPEDNSHWAEIMRTQGPPPGGEEPVEVNTSGVKLCVKATHVQEALDWLSKAIEDTHREWLDAEERRLVAEREASEILERWWQRSGLQPGR